MRLVGTQWFQDTVSPPNYQQYKIDAFESVVIKYLCVFICFVQIGQVKKIVSEDHSLCCYLEIPPNCSFRVFRTNLDDLGLSNDSPLPHPMTQRSTFEDFSPCP